MTEASTRPWPAPPAALLTAAVVVSVLAAQLEPFTRPTEVAIGGVTLAVFALALWAGWHRPGPVGGPPPPRGAAWRKGLVVWAVLVAAIGLFQLAQFQSNPRSTYPTLSSLASIAFAHWPVRAAAIAVWLVLGGYLIGPRR